MTTERKSNAPRRASQDAQYQGNQPAYKEHGDGTVSDINTGLMWIQDPDGKKTYEEAVAGGGVRCIW